MRLLLHIMPRDGLFDEHHRSNRFSPAVCLLTSGVPRVPSDRVGFIKPLQTSKAGRPLKVAKARLPPSKSMFTVYKGEWHDAPFHPWRASKVGCLCGLKWIPGILSNSLGTVVTSVRQNASIRNHCCVPCSCTEFWYLAATTPPTARCPTI